MPNVYGVLDEQPKGERAVYAEISQPDNNSNHRPIPGPVAEPIVPTAPSRQPEVEYTQVQRRSGLIVIDNEVYGNRETESQLTEESASVPKNSDAVEDDNDLTVVDNKFYGSH